MSVSENRKTELRIVGPNMGSTGGPKKKPRATKNAPQSLEPAALNEAGLRDRAATLATGFRSANTTHAYAGDWRHFAAWCESSGFAALPATPETVALYLSAYSQRHKPATLSRRLVGISQTHQDAGFEPPTRAVVVRRTFRAICREQGTAQNQKTPILTNELVALVGLLPDTLQGKRDKALLLIGFAGAFRRSEIVGLNVADLALVADGLLISLKRSKTDQEGKGVKVGVPFAQNASACPVRAYKEWLSASGIKSGAVFRGIDQHGNVSAVRLSGHSASCIVKRAVGAMGLEPSEYGGHSLRAGLVTSAAREGASELEIMAQTGHKSREMVGRYFREANLFKNNAAAKTKL